MTKAAHPAYPLPTNIRSEQRAEPVPPKLHSFLTDIDPALEQQILDVPQRQGELDIHRDHEAHDSLSDQLKRLHRLPGLARTTHCCLLPYSSFTDRCASSDSTHRRTRDLPGQFGRSAREYLAELSAYSQRASGRRSSTLFGMGPGGRGSPLSQGRGTAGLVSLTINKLAFPAEVVAEARPRGAPTLPAYQPLHLV